MPAYNIGTTATMLISSVSQAISFDIHADADNTDTVNLATDDPSVTNPEEELLAGQSVTFSGFKGTVWAKAEAGTQTVSIFSVGYDTEIAKTGS